MSNPLAAIGVVADVAGGLLDRIWPKKMDEEERATKIAEMVPLLQQFESTVINAKRDIMVAELSQGDEYTKRTRPWLVRCGMYVIIFNHVAVPFINKLLGWIVYFKKLDITVFGQIPTVDLPTEFWVAWGGWAGVYALGRSAEKLGVRNKVLDAIMGTKG